ncbi:MAG: radical SAM protein [Chloroflexi bacterium]|nr:radical SAM protein [Chloroflexota bacterium]
MGYSVGIGLTNDCNLNCAHCYRDTGRVDALSLAQVQQICEAIPVDALGMGTGENALHPEFVPIVRYLSARGVKLSLASNGYSLTTIADDVLRAFHDVEVSIDFATEAEQDTFRGPGNWALVHGAMARCRRLGVEASILATLMRTNYDQMDQLVALARRNGVNLRVNAYQAVKTDAYRLTYAEFWEGYRRLFADGLVISCSEPVVRAAMGLDAATSPCGQRSLRFNPRGQIVPCVYWPLDGASAPSIADLAQSGAAVMDSPAFQAARFQPPVAADCACRGGCASRRALNRNLDAHDDYCPWVRGETIALDWRPAPAKDLMRSGNVCTTVVV